MIVLLWLALGLYVAHLMRGGRWLGRVATGSGVLAWIVWTVGLIVRARAAGHWPLANRYEFSLCCVWAVLSVYLLLEASWGERRGGALVLGVALLMATYAVTRPASEQAAAPLLPVLRSLWLQVHVLTAAVGYAGFGVAAGLGVMRLAMRGDWPRWPETADVERTMRRAVALGFPWLTLSILAGGVWAQKAWGRYWGWDPKETWALLTWLWYLVVLHVSPLRRWSGRCLAALVVGGFVMLVFAFIGVPWLVRAVRLESLHGF